MAQQFGYAGKILKVDLFSGNVTCIPTMDYADRFIGGIGIGAKIYWDEVPLGVRAFDPENLLIFATGPLAGIGGIPGPRWEICGKSPDADPEQFRHCNVGGSWGVQLKFAGYDGLIVQGKAEKPAYLLIQDEAIEMRDAYHLWGKGAIEVREILKGELGNMVSVVAIGPAGEKKVTLATILADNDASGSVGLGAVMGSKMLKAIVVRGSGKIMVGNQEKLKLIVKSLGELKQTQQEPDLGLIAGPNLKKDHCYGCLGGCVRAIYESSDGKKGKFMCQSGLFYQEIARKYYGEWNEVPFHANKLCDEYGLDTASIEPMIRWLAKCRKVGILNDNNTGIPLSKLGSLEFIETLVKKISLRDGFGDALAQGIYHAADFIGGGATELLTDYIVKGRYPPHDPRVYVIEALLYATEIRISPCQLADVWGPLFQWWRWLNKQNHAYVSNEVLRGMAKRFLGGELALDFSTYEGKALALKKVQDRYYMKHSLILCAFWWPMTIIKNYEDQTDDDTIESKLYSAVTGAEMDDKGLCDIGDTIFNLQRAIVLREGHKGKESDVLPESFYNMPVKMVGYNPECLVPGKGDEVISRKGAVVERGRFEQMKDEYYMHRGWDVHRGLLRKAKLEQLGLKDIIDDLEQRGLAV